VKFIVYRSSVIVWQLFFFLQVWAL